MTASEDQADVEKVLTGDIAAFEGIVRRWQSPLINLAYRFCRDRGRSEEMAQEAFLRAYTALGQWRREGAFSTWLFALAANIYCSELRRIPLKMVNLEEAADLMDLHNINRSLEDEDRKRAVRNAVAALPAKYREALTLFYFHDMNVTAAAESLGLPEGTVKARLYRGREMLRSKLLRVFPTQRLREA
jgi:RNA polymerase sigma-70 factor, ECF subfamily